MLRENVHRRFGDGKAVEVALANGANQRRAFKQVVARRGKEASFGHRSVPVSRAANALQGRSNGTRRANLANEVDAADVDSQFE